MDILLHIKKKPFLKTLLGILRLIQDSFKEIDQRCGQRLLLFMLLKQKIDMPKCMRLLATANEICRDGSLKVQGRF